MEVCSYSSSTLATKYPFSWGSLLELRGLKACAMEIKMTGNLSRWMGHHPRLKQGGKNAFHRCRHSSVNGKFQLKKRSKSNFFAVSRFRFPESGIPVHWRSQWLIRSEQMKKSRKSSFQLCEISDFPAEQKHTMPNTAMEFNKFTSLSSIMAGDIPFMPLTYLFKNLPFFNKVLLEIFW